MTTDFTMEPCEDPKAPLKVRCHTCDQELLLAEIDDHAMAHGSIGIRLTGSRK